MIWVSFCPFGYIFLLHTLFNSSTGSDISQFLLVIAFLCTLVVQKLVQVKRSNSDHFLSLPEFHLPYTIMSLLIQVSLMHSIRVTNKHITKYGCCNFAIFSRKRITIKGSLSGEISSKFLDVGIKRSVI